MYLGPNSAGQKTGEIGISPLLSEALLSKIFGSGKIFIKWWP